MKCRLITLKAVFSYQMQTYIDLKYEMKLKKHSI